MEAKQVTLWVYADNEQEISDLKKELNKFVMDKSDSNGYCRMSAMVGTATVPHGGLREQLVCVADHPAQ